VQQIRVINLFGDPMSSAVLDPVLAHIDAHIEQSTENLFKLLRIPSISTDPAYREGL
jgi:hypothetical protein